jgi:very-short-patch-repair endonuclease
MLPYNDKLKIFSTELRNNLTEAEQKLWHRLRRKQVLGVQFYRQKPIAAYIVDFYCAAANLVIELDGSQHYEAIHQANDIERDKVLQALGLQVLRFDNRQVLVEIDEVMAVIFNAVELRI